MGTESGITDLQVDDEETVTRAEIVHASGAFATRLCEAEMALTVAHAPDADVASLRGMAGFCELMVAEGAKAVAPASFSDLSSVYMEVGNQLGALGRRTAGTEPGDPAADRGRALRALQPGRADRRAPSALRRPLMAGEKATVVVIDDSEVCLELAKDALEAAGYRVVTTKQGVGFNHLLRKVGANLALIDVNMPGLSGDRLAKITTGSKFCPVLLHSDMSEVELRVKVRESGAAGFVRKQPLGTGLVEAVRVALAQAAAPKWSGGKL
jgi:CheY-like chemotaxis protein